MPVPQRPPLNGRNIAEFYVATETAKRSTLRDYAKPPELQQARVIMYDPVRRLLAEYFGGGREGWRIFRDWRDIRLEQRRDEPGTA